MPKRNISLSSDYRDAVNNIQTALRAESAAEVVRRSLQLLEFAHETSLTVTRVKKSKSIGGVKPIEIGNIAFFQKRPPIKNSLFNLMKRQN